MPPLQRVRGCYLSAACRDSGRTMPAAFTLLAISTRLIATSYQMLGRHLVLPLAFPKLNYRNLLPCGECLQGRDKVLADRVHEGAGNKLVSALVTKESDYAQFALPLRHIHVQVHPIDPFDLQGDVIGQHFGHTSWYVHFGSGTPPIPGDRLPQSGLYRWRDLLAILHCRPEPFLPS